MRKTVGSVLIALAVLAGGVCLILDAIGLIQISLFKGWWTLFIIIPALISIFTSRIHAGHFIFLGVGVILLLNANGLLAGINLWLLILGVIVVSVGLSMLLRPHFKGPRRISRDQEGYFAVFSGTSAINNSQDFQGADATAVFGGVELDLREIILTQDAYVNATAIFGGVELYVPQNVQVKISGVPIFGGFDDKTSHLVHEGPTLFIHCIAAFGGVEILEDKKQK